MSAGVTYATAKAKVERDLDLEEEIFIQSSEMLEYFNEAIREAEAEMTAVYQDYFLSSYPVPVVNGTASYDLPSDIYSDKIRAIIYDNGSSIIYEIKQNRSLKKFLERSFIKLSNASTGLYKYMLTNTSSAGPKLELIPTPNETTSTSVVVWYWRKLVDLSSDTDTIKIPTEVINFIYAHVKGSCLKKENAGIMPDDAKSEIEKQRALMLVVVSNRIPDDDNEVEQDLSIYREHS